jgi:hypothetical protein
MRFELAFAAPVSTLRKYVREYVGWVDYSGTPVSRRELPSGIVPLIINFGATVRERKAGSDRWNAYGTFTAGLHEAFTIVESAGPNVGIQVNFTAIGSGRVSSTIGRSPSSRIAPSSSPTSSDDPPID